MLKGIISFKKIFTLAFIGGISLTILNTNSFGQQIHSKKKVFQDVKTWKATSPGSVKLKNFSPFRAVYNRTYKQGSGPNAGDPRNDRVIISAEEIGWDGKRAVSISLIDSGIVKHSDTNARVLNMFVGMDKLNALFEIGPIPGKAKDYYIGRFAKGTVYLNLITTDKQTLTPRKMETDKIGFGPNAWVMASMNLSKGLKINLSPAFSLRGNSLTSATYGHIVGQKEFTDGSGKKHKAWVLETSRNLATPRVSHVYLINKPPYYLGTETVDLATKERKKFVWLNNVQLFKN